MRMQPWSLVFPIGFMVYVGIRGVFKQRPKRHEKAVSHPVFPHSVAASA